jgi:adenine-specific DNA-methyltransferase
MNAQDKRVQNRQQLQSLLRQLFQFDSADLDFGIYRIMNEKRTEIERFIERDLLDAVEQGLAHFQAAEREELEAQIAAKRDDLGPDAFDESGAVREEYKKIKIAQDYMVLRQQLQRLELAEETEARIFNDLWCFFSRYYDNGDFLTERRYSSREPKFCIPYNGEEVLLHWANRGQYYVKTSERFTDYRFSVGEYTVWFRLQHAEEPPDNVKGNTRHFVLRQEDPLVYDAESRTLTICFEYRPITEEEEAHYLGVYNALQGRSDRRKTLDRLSLCAALEVQILNGLDEASLKAHLAAVPAGQNASPLGRHLNRYTARNTMDYFVHKDLGGFLRRELDFFLKNEVLRIDDVIGDESGEMMGHVLTRMRVVRQIAEKIIAFLAQIEDFQRRLFEKKKFVVQTGYCITLDRVPEEFYAEILANEAQLQEWRRLYNIDAWDEDLFWQGEFDTAFLQAHPYMMLDTGLFPEEGYGNFKARLLATFDDLEETTDGVLVNGENFQVLNLLQSKYRDQVKCIYIDPPFNTGEDEFVYKDNYQHSSWLSMMEDRLAAARPLVTGDGLILISIDDIEQHTLRMLASSVFGKFLGNIVWQSRQSVDSRATSNLSNDHEFILTYGTSLRGGLKDLEKFSNPDNDPRGLWRSADMTGLATKERRPNLHYDILLALAEDVLDEDSDIILRAGGWEIRKDETEDKVIIEQEAQLIEQGVRVLVLGDREGEVFKARYLCSLPETLTNLPQLPVYYECPPKGWRFEPPMMASKVKEERILFPSDPSGRPRHKLFWDEMGSVYTGFSTVVKTVIPYEVKKGGPIDPAAEVYTRHGTRELNALFGQEVVQFPKPTELIEVLVEQSGGDNDLVMDFFAGSGTTAHAVISLNRKDGGNRKYILVEIGEYFNTVLKPRIQKVVFSANWENGIPQTKDGQSHMFKYQRIESYEDALTNIRVRQPEGAQRRLLYEEFSDYQLHYMLDFETRDSPTLLAPEAFETPFNYTLKIQRGHESPQDTVVDLVETFHYLIGMHVQRLERHEHQDRAYVVSRGEVRNERGIEKVAVVWRDTEKLDLNQEADWLNAELPARSFDRVYVNGPSHVEKAQPLEITFRDRMESGAGGPRGV